MTLPDERGARALLATWSEPGDAELGSRVRAVGAQVVVSELVDGVSPLRRAAAMEGRIAPDRRRGLDTAYAAALRADHVGARYVIPGDAEWPTQLDDLGHLAPLGLWVAGSGDLRLLALRSISVVGARAATPYGEGIARALGAEVADAGWTCVSGGAFGIDAAAHRGTLAAEGATICIVAGGVDVPYPRAHVDLLARIREGGLVVSETALGGAPMRQRFLTRNRLIAALTRGTVVVEAALRSGSRTTALEASRLSRVVMAFPGPVTSPLSQGCHALLRAPGTLLVTSARDVLDLMEGRVAERPAGDQDLSPREATVLDAVPVRRAAAVDRLVRTAGLTPNDVLAGLGVLEALGMVQRRDGGWIRRPGRGTGRPARTASTMDG